MSHHYLGGELEVAGILLRLPVKSLLRFRCVCKSWNSLISSPYFISSQLRYSRTNHTQALMHHWDGRCAAICLSRVEDDHVGQPLSLDFGFESPNVQLHVIGASGGLICYVGVQQYLISKFIVFNPEIKSFLSVLPPLPSLEHPFMITGFGFDDTTLDYKIFLAECHGSDIYLYSLNSSSWKFISCRFSWYTIIGGDAIFMKGVFHWVTYGNFQHSYPVGTYPDHGTYTTAFDIKSEIFRPILFPERLLGQVGLIEGFDESSIGAVQTLEGEGPPITHVWLMDQNGSWSKLADDIKVDKRSTGKEVLGFKNKDELIIRLYGSKRVIVLKNINNEGVRQGRLDNFRGPEQK